jgi:hypothetical protein
MSIQRHIGKLMLFSMGEGYAFGMMLQIVPAIHSSDKYVCQFDWFNGPPNRKRTHKLVLTADEIEQAANLFDLLRSTNRGIFE